MCTNLQWLSNLAYVNFITYIIQVLHVFFSYHPVSLYPSKQGNNRIIFPLSFDMSFGFNA